MNQNKNISDATVNEALNMAKQTQKPGQTKEQTRLIAQGIQKGIAEYKKSIKAKQRQADKAQKKQQKQKALNTENNMSISENEVVPSKKGLPWVLLVISWVMFASYIFYTK